MKHLSFVHFAFKCFNPFFCFLNQPSSVSEGNIIWRQKIERGSSENIETKHFDFFSPLPEPCAKFNSCLQIASANPKLHFSANKLNYLAKKCLPALAKP